MDFKGNLAQSGQILKSRSVVVSPQTQELLKGYIYLCYIYLCYICLCYICLLYILKLSCLPASIGNHLLNL